MSRRGLKQPFNQRRARSAKTPCCKCHSTAGSTCERCKCATSGKPCRSCGLHENCKNPHNKTRPTGGQKRVHEKDQVSPPQRKKTHKGPAKPPTRPTMDQVNVALNDQLQAGDFTTVTAGGTQLVPLEGHELALFIENEFWQASGVRKAAYQFLQVIGLQRHLVCFRVWTWRSKDGLLNKKCEDVGVAWGNALFKISILSVNDQPILLLPCDNGTGTSTVQQDENGFPRPHRCKEKH